MADTAPENQDQPQNETAPATESTETSTTDQANTEDSAPAFTDSYNPDELPEEARAAYDAAYKRLQADYTRKTQEVSSQRREAEQAQALVNALRNPATQAQALQMLGLELEDDSEDTGYVDPDERIDRLEQMLTEREKQAEEERRMEQEATQIDSELQRLSKADGRDLDDSEIELIVSFAVANRLDDGSPNVEAGYRQLQALYSEAQKRHIESKRNAPAPGIGSAAEKKWQLDTEEGRKAAMAEIAAANFEQSS